MELFEQQYRSSEAELQEQVVALTQQKRELAEYAERVTRELRRYQQSRPAPSSQLEDDMPLPPWATNMQMMSPLLYSYEERIAELEAVIERSTSLAEQAQVLAKENDSLRTELQERTEQYRRSQLVPPVREGASNDQQQEELQELYRLSVEQNEALAQQNELLKVQVERMQQNLVGYQEQARVIQARAVGTNEALSAEQEKADAFARQRSAVEKRLEEVNGELIEDIRAREQAEKQYESLRHECQLQSQSLDMLKQSQAERDSLTISEEERLKSELERVSRHDRQQRHRISALEKEFAKVSEELGVARREEDAAKQGAAQWVRLNESLERQLKDVTDRHDDARQKLAAEQSRAGELLLEKDSWSSAETAAQRAAERRQTLLHSELEALREQRETDLEKERSSRTREKTGIDDRFKKAEQAAAELHMKLELSEKQRSWEAAAVDSQSSVHTAERARLQADLEEGQQGRLRLERQVSAARQEAAKFRTELESVAAEAREQSGHANSELASVRTKMQQAERSLSQVREELQHSEAKVGQVASDQARLQSELQEERFRSGGEAERERRKAQADRRILERQVQSMAAKANQGEQRAVELLRSQEMLQQQWQAEFAAETQTLESQVKQLSAENRTMRDRSRGLVKALAVRRAVAASEQFGGEDLPRNERAGTLLKTAAAW